MIVSHGNFVGSFLGLVGNVEKIGTKVDFSMVGLGSDQRCWPARENQRVAMA